MYAGEESMFGHVGDQLNGLESRMSGFDLDDSHSLDPHMLDNGDSMKGGPGVGMQNGSASNSSTDMAIKVLVSNKDAGSLIGKNGSTIVSFQAATGSRVRVSRADEPFPGTQERVVLITGSLECVSPCLSLVIEQVHKHFSDYPYADKDVHPMDPNAHRTMNLVVPAAASGLIIGRGGDTVRALASKSGSHIQLAGRERQIQGLSERLLCLTGSLTSNVAAARCILQILHDDPSGKYDNVSTSYRGFTAALPSPHKSHHQAIPPSSLHHRSAQPPHLVPHRSALRGRMHNSMDLAGGALLYNRYAQGDAHAIFSNTDVSSVFHDTGMDAFSGPGLLQQIGQQVMHAGGGHAPLGDARAAATQMTMQVPDAVVPIILGKGGAIMREIQQRSGARIRVSQKGEYVPGTTDRIVTISAPSHHEAHGAYLMVASKIGIT